MHKLKKNNKENVQTTFHTNKNSAQYVETKITTNKVVKKKELAEKLTQSCI